MGSQNLVWRREEGVGLGWGCPLSIRVFRLPLFSPYWYVCFGFRCFGIYCTHNLFVLYPQMRIMRYICTHKQVKLYPQTSEVVPTMDSTFKFRIRNEDLTEWRRLSSVKGLSVGEYIRQCVWMVNIGSDVSNWRIDLLEKELVECKTKLVENMAVSPSKKEIGLSDEKKAKLESLKVLTGQAKEPEVTKVLVEQVFGETESDRRMMKKLRQEEVLSPECQRLLDRMRAKMIEHDSQVALDKFWSFVGDW